jgi:hypothetical protein
MLTSLAGKGCVMATSASQDHPHLQPPPIISSLPSQRPDQRFAVAFLVASGKCRSVRQPGRWRTARLCRAYGQGYRAAPAMKAATMQVAGLSRLARARS